MGNHSKMFGICENKCLVEVSPKEETDANFAKKQDKLSGTDYATITSDKKIRNDGVRNVTIGRGVVGFTKPNSTNKNNDDIVNMTISTLVDAGDGISIASPDGMSKPVIKNLDHEQVVANTADIATLKEGSGKASIAYGYALPATGNEGDIFLLIK